MTGVGSTTEDANLDSATFSAASAALGGWKDIPFQDREDSENIGVDRGNLSEVKSSLGRLLGAENLVILTGLGTSLDIRNGQGAMLAPTMKDLWDEVVLLPSFEAVADHFSNGVLEAKNLEYLLSEALSRQTLASDEEFDAFIKEAEEIILDKCNFVLPETNVEYHEIFLRKVARRSTRLMRTQLFTTNYDRAFEVAAVNVHFNVIDGFGMHRDGRFEGGSFDLDVVRRRSGEQLALEPNVLHLLKLHGSVDWQRQGEAVVRTHLRPTKPVLIYPAQNKFQLSYQQPYLEMMARFQMALRQPDVGLLIVGFGFNDAHLVAPIEAAVSGNIGLRMVVVDPNIRGANRNGALLRLERLIDAEDRRAMLIRATFSELTRLLPDIPPFDERDVHDRRITRSQGQG